MLAAKAFLNFFHLSSTMIWIGSITFLTLILTLIFKKRNGDFSLKLIDDIFRVFKVLSTICIIIIIASGILLSAQRDFSELTITSSYGILFLIKHLLLLTIAGLIFISKFYLFSKIRNLCIKEESEALCLYQKKLLIAMFISTFLGLIIILLTVFMQLM